MVGFSYVNYDNLSYLSNHVFLPPKLPQKDDIKQPHVVALSRLAGDIAKEYRDRLDAAHRRCWNPIVRMLENMYRFTDLPSLDRLKEDFVSMAVDGKLMFGLRCCIRSLSTVHIDILALYVRAQNAAIIVRKYAEKTVFEIFEVSPAAAMVMGTEGKLICSYPGPAVEIPNDVFNNGGFQEELASFIVQMDVDNLDSAPTTTKAGSKVVEERDTQDPRYISQLLVGILRGMGQGATVRRISKRIADDVLCKDALKPWRRSGLWLIIRVAIQTSLHINDYKAFILFLHSRLLHLCLGFDFSSDLIFCMRAKTSRRAYKLGSAAPDFVLQEVQATGSAAEVILRDRWTKIQRAQENFSFWAPEVLDLASDTVLSLPNCRDYLSRALQSDLHQNSQGSFTPSHAPRVREIRDFRQLEGDRLTRAVTEDPYVALADFEQVVQDHLDEWLAKNMTNASSATTLASCLDQYFDCAHSRYSSNAEDQSLMILTMMELWVAIDRVALEHCRLLEEYSPEIPTAFLEPLLLRHALPLSRATAVENYLRSRHGPFHVKPSIFSDEVGEQSFAVRFFTQSKEHQDLKIAIERRAAEKRQEKVKELRLQNVQYAEYLSTASQLQHDHTYGVLCLNCHLKRTASRMKIFVYEWPLPNDRLSAEVLVFELRCPEPFATWRSSTYKILCDLGMHRHGQENSARPQIVLENYNGLTEWVNVQVRITLASPTQYIHNRYASLPADKKTVCVSNSLKFDLYDKTQNAWAAGPFSESSIAPRCIDTLPVGRYQGLQYSLDGTLHTSNEVIANQVNCPKDLSLHEYISFASLRSGSRLQWLNITRELASNALSFDRKEVHALITRAAWQIGSLSYDGDRREWHEDLENAQFGLVLLSELDNLLTSIESNWLGGVTAKTISMFLTVFVCASLTDALSVLLVDRLLASASDSSVHDKAYTLLRRARVITARWMRQLAAKIQESHEVFEALELQLRTCNMAATCRATFDVDPQHLEHLLKNAEDVAIALECAVVVHDNKPSSLDTASTGFQRIFYRDRRLSHYLEPFLLKLIRSDRRGIDTALLSLWPSYRHRDTIWKELPAPNSRWLTNLTAIDFSGAASQTVHLNLLDGTLLIDGKPLGRLPRAIFQHPTYVRVFDQVGIFDLEH